MSIITEMEILVVGQIAILTALLLWAAIWFGSVIPFLLALWAGRCLCHAVNEFNRIVPRAASERDMEASNG